MAYIKQTWQDGSAGGTPVNAARLNYIEDGIVAAHTRTAHTGTQASTTISDFTEAAQDASASAFTAGTHSGISFVYDDTNHRVNATVNAPAPTMDNLPLAVPATVTWTGTAWPARTTATSQAGRRVFFIGNPGGTAPGDMQTNDVWTQG